MNSNVILSCFADESSRDKTIDQQFSAVAATGLENLSIRFVDAGNGVRNVLELDDTEFSLVRKHLDEYGLRIASIGSPVGKVKIADFEDDTRNRFVPFQQYLATEVQAACDAATRLETKLIRGFSFYHPRDTDYSPWFQQAVDQLGVVAETCDAQGLTFGLEVEANLIGHTGSILNRIHQAVNHPALVLVFDGGNLVTQGFNRQQILEQFREMLPGLGWLHVKDYLSSESAGNRPGDYVDEDALNRFVPADRGSAGHSEIFRELAKHLPEINSRLGQRDIHGFVIDLEPHLRGGGQYGGYSGPDGLGIALRGLCHVLDQAEVGHRLKSFEDLSGTRSR